MPSRRETIEQAMQRAGNHCKSVEVTMTRVKTH